MKKKRNMTLRIVGVLFAFIIIFSSVRLVFANQDIAYILESWINDKRIDSIAQIERTISIEQEEQTRRLKGEIQLAIKNAEREYQAFLQEEKSKLKESLVTYADHLISNYEVEIEKDEEVILKLECIAIKAEIEMDIALGMKDESEAIDCGVISGEETPKEEAEGEEGVPAEETTEGENPTDEDKPEGDHPADGEEKNPEDESTAEEDKPVTEEEVE